MRTELQYREWFTDTILSEVIHNPNAIPRIDDEVCFVNEEKHIIDRWKVIKIRHTYTYGFKEHMIHIYLEEQK